MESTQLTAEVLLKNGFVTKDNSEMLHFVIVPDFANIAIHPVDGSFAIYGDYGQYQKGQSAAFDRKIKTRLQLQNILYALTAEVTIIK